jgi:hypothetical protein
MSSTQQRSPEVNMVSDAIEFFTKHAGYSYKPPETPEQGQLRAATALGNAEDRAIRERVKFTWSACPEEWDGDEPLPEWAELLDCLAKHPDGRTASLGSIALDGRKVDPYARVVEAELALEIFGGDE